MITLYVCKACGAHLTLNASVSRTDCIEVRRCACRDERLHKDGYTEGYADCARDNEEDC